jgi:hypothetical protein
LGMEIAERFMSEALIGLGGGLARHPGLRECGMDLAEAHETLLGSA